MDELAELFLAYLYDKAEAEAHSFFFFPLDEFVTRAEITDGATLLKAAQGLEDRGFVMLSQNIMGEISAFINLEGSSFVESGGETGIIGRYRQNPDAFLKEEESPSWLSEPDEVNIVQFTPEMMQNCGAASAPATPTVPETPSQGDERKQYILDIINVILDDTTIDDVTRADFLRDAETLNIQLAKTVRNRTVIDALMAELLSLPSLAQLVAQLSSFI